MSNPSAPLFIVTYTSRQQLSNIFRGKRTLLLHLIHRRIHLLIKPLIRPRLQTRTIPIPVLNPTTNTDVITSKNNLWRIRARTLAPSFDGNKDVQETWKEEPGDGDEDDAVSDEESPHIERLGAVGCEGRVREREDDAEDGGADVAEADGPGPGDGPVFADCDGDVEIAAELVALVD